MANKQTGVIEMTQAKHTPGPWTIRGQYVEAAKHAVVAQVNMPYEIGSDAAVSITGVMNANAALIAAAPELLVANIQLVEQVKQLLDQIEKVQRGEWKSTSICTSAARVFAADARTAIAKAGGAA